MLLNLYLVVQTSTILLYEKIGVVKIIIRRIENMQELVDKGGHAIKLDVTDDESIQNAVNQIISDRWFDKIQMSQFK